MKPTLYLLMGLPGSGKTTTAKILERLTHATRLSSDELRLKLWKTPTFSLAEHQQLYDVLDKQTRELLVTGNDVIYDANLNRLVHRQEKYGVAQSLGAETKLIWVQTPTEVAKHRRVTEGAHHVLVPSGEDPASMFDRIAGIIEEPKSSETYIALDGQKISEQYIVQKLGLHVAHRP